LRSQSKRTPTDRIPPNTSTKGNKCSKRKLYTRA
jgi:hypothetical protein